MSVAVIIEASQVHTNLPIKTQKENQNEVLAKRAKEK